MAKAETTVQRLRGGRLMGVSPLAVAGVAAALLIVFGFLWWRFVYANPGRVFHAMLDNSLQLRGITRHVTEDNNGQAVDQTVHLNLSAEPLAISRTVLSQTGDSTKVITEGIGTATTDYVRYVTIDTEQTNAAGQPINFEPVLNIWGTSDQASDDNQFTDGELYNESVLGVVPFGRLGYEQRAELMELIRQENVYEVDYDNVRRHIENGRPRYTYPVTVDASAYVLLLKNFGELMGLNHLSELDPAAYANAERLPFTLTVDVWSRQLTKIEYDQGQRTEELSGHNAQVEIHVPESPIPVRELQQRLQGLQ